MQPNLRSRAIFQFKATILRAQRVLTDAKSGKSAGIVSQNLTQAPVVGTSVTALWTHENQAEFRLTAGKIENLRIAARKMHGREFQAGEVFSFWEIIGRPSKSKGYTEGREIREGCVIPSVAGGLCQLSNALYDAALKAGFEIIERHAHTRVIKGSLAEVGRDATIFWNYVDLRFTCDRDFRIEVDLSDADLRVQFRATSKASRQPDPIPQKKNLANAASCETCGVITCSRNIAMNSAAATTLGITAFLVDAYWPELDKWMQERAAQANAHGETLLVKPMRNYRGRFPQYGWSESNFSKTKTVPLVTLQRSIAMRKVQTQGAVRQKKNLEWTAKLAAAMARHLPPEATHLVVTQDLLMPLMKLGVFGGRTYEVMMQRQPISLLQTELDRAKQLHPESPTLGDFRAPADIIKAEADSLARAKKLITPSFYLAEQLGAQAVRIEWAQPKLPESMPKAAISAQPTILMAGPIAGRHGAYEVRALAKELGLKVLGKGALLEKNNFWDGVQFEKLPPHITEVEAIAMADLVVAPSFVTSAPRIALKALAMNKPVVASTQCGIHPHASEQLKTIHAGDYSALHSAVCELLSPIVRSASAI